MQTQQTLKLSCYNCDTVLLFNINLIVDCLTAKQLHVSVCYGIVNIGFSNSVYYFRKKTRTCCFWWKQWSPFTIEINESFNNFKGWSCLKMFWNLALKRLKIKSQGTNTFNIIHEKYVHVYVYIYGKMSHSLIGKFIFVLTLLSLVP